MNKKIIYPILMFLATATIILILSVIYQSHFPNLIIIGLIGLCLISAATLISGINDSFDIFEKIYAKLENRSVFSWKLKKEVLMYISNHKQWGLEIEILDSFIKEKEPNFTVLERKKLINELNECGYTEIKSNLVYPTQKGEKKVKKF